MEWVDLIQNGLAVAGGGLTGILGAVLGVGTKWLQERQRQKWEKEKWTHEERLLEMQMQAGAAETEQELAIATANGSWAGLEASVNADAAIGVNTSQWVRDWRSMFRLIFTALLWLMSGTIFGTLVFVLVSGQYREWIDTAELVELIRYCVHVTLYTASTAGAWWFGDRAFSPPGSKHK